MRATVMIEHATPLAGRLATAFVELTLAAAVVVGALFAGHNLREWRDWYPASYHPWLDTQRAAPEVVEP